MKAEVEFLSLIEHFYDWFQQEIYDFLSTECFSQFVIPDLLFSGVKDLKP